MAVTAEDPLELQVVVDRPAEELEREVIGGSEDGRHHSLIYLICSIFCSICLHRICHSTSLNFNCVLMRYRIWDHDEIEKCGSIDYLIYHNLHFSSLPRTRLLV
jgi:hypothetical protein